jgi:hypothetical protein
MCKWNIVQKQIYASILSTLCGDHDFLIGWTWVFFLDDIIICFICFEWSPVQNWTRGFKYVKVWLEMGFEIKDSATCSRCHKSEVFNYFISVSYRKSANDKSHLYDLFDPPPLITISRNETDASWQTYIIYLDTNITVLYQKS